MKIKVEQIAKELLLEEDCVVIPEFGGFVTNYRSAFIEPSKNILLPPSKHISFNAKLSKNDGLLAKAISEKLGISYQEALDGIQSRVGQWRSELETKHYLEFDELGSFILNKEGNLVFEQFNETNFLDTSFGLTNVHAVPVERVGISHKIERGLTNQKAQPKLLKVMVRVAAAAVVVFVVSTVTWGYKSGELDATLNFFSTGNNNVEVVDEVPVDVIAGKSNAVNIEKPLEVAKNDQFFDPEETQLLKDVGVIGDEVNIERVKALKEEKEQKDVMFKEQPVQVNSDNNYHVIAGCFGVASNADKMILQLKAKGYNATLAGKSRSGLFRVAYGSYSSKVKALKALAKAKLSHNSKAWIAHN